MIDAQNIFGVVCNELPAAQHQLAKIDDVKNPVKVLRCVTIHLMETRRSGKTKEFRHAVKLVNRLHIETSGHLRDVLEWLLLPQLKQEILKVDFARELPGLFYESRSHRATRIPGI